MCWAAATLFRRAFLWFARPWTFNKRGKNEDRKDLVSRVLGKRQDAAGRDQIKGGSFGALAAALHHGPMQTNNQTVAMRNN